MINFKHRKELKMEKMLISKLSKEQLKALIDSNKEFSQMVEEAHTENEMYWINEIVDCFKDSLSDWSIGFYNQNYLKIQNDVKFIQSFKVYAETYGVSEETQSKLDEALKVVEEYEKDDNDEYDIATLEAQSKILKDELLEYLNATTTVENEYLYEYLDIMIEDGKLESMYILNDDTTTVFESIIKEYK